MADTGFLTPNATGFSVFSLSTNTWANPTNAYTLDSNAATHTPVSSDQFQSYGDFNISIPNGNKISGIQVLINCKSSDNVNLIVAYVCRRTRGFSRMVVGSNNIGLDYSGYTLGTSTTLPTDDAAGDWIDSDTSNSEFCILIQDWPQNRPTWTTSVDVVSLKIYYEPVPSGFLAWYN